MPVLVATDREVVVIDVERCNSASAHGMGDRPTCLVADPLVQGRAWCGTDRGGVFRSDDGGKSWKSVGLSGRLIMAVAASPVEQDVVWVGSEPSEVWLSGDAGDTWEQTSRLETLASASEWSFPPRPDTHHVRWIACHLLEPGRLWVAIEAGALVSTIDGGRTWRDRVPGGPWDTHELAIHRNAPESLRVLLAMDTSKATTLARRGARPAPVSRLATCAASRSIRSTLTLWLFRPRPVRTQRMSLAAPMVACTGVSRASVGSACATAGRSRRPQSRRCSAPAQTADSFGRQMNAACTVRMTAGRVGARPGAMRRRRSICAASRWCSNADQTQRPAAPGRGPSA
jgi:hypothetical protein